jgi:hypothetical protein
VKLAVATMCAPSYQRVSTLCLHEVTACHCGIYFSLLAISLYKMADHGIIGRSVPMDLLDTSFLVPLEPAIADHMVASPPFIPLEGAANFRDLGNLAASHRGERYKTRQGKVFRCAQLSHLRPEGMKKLQSLRIKAVFDLRSAYEINAYEGTRLSLEGMEVHHVPIMDDDYFSPAEVTRREADYEAKGEDGLIEEYLVFLENAGQSFGTIFRYMRDFPEDAIIVHCACKAYSFTHCSALADIFAVGKDRTGLFVALLLLVSH